MKTLLCFGDSNTHGTPPMSEAGEQGRYPDGIRWPTVARAALGDGWRLVEEGLPGRTTQFDDPAMGQHMNGIPGLKIALLSHCPFDVLTIMLGTNDLKIGFGATPEGIAAGVAMLLRVARHRDMIARTGPFRILLICPPPAIETGPFRSEFLGAEARSRALPRLYRDLAEANGVGFLDAGGVIASSPVDGIHFGEDAHRALGMAVAEAVGAL